MRSSETFSFLLFLFHGVNEHGFCGLNILFVFGYNTTNIPDIHVLYVFVVL